MGRFVMGRCVLEPTLVEQGLPLVLLWFALAEQGLSLVCYSL